MAEERENKEKVEQESVIVREIETEMKESYLNYSMSVIIGRALPDVRDGLKPVHRRILFAMHQMGMFHNKPFKKCARIVGEVLGKYHPHGDTAVYDSLVRLAQPFSMRYPLIQGQGNFGSLDGDSAAAMRYTEARLNRLSEEMLQDIDKDTVDFTDNFDGSLKEPAVLPAKLPNLLINGSSGIAVGMATNIPPHNLGEVIDAAVGMIDNPDIAVQQIMHYLKGPDFPTGGIICGKNGIINAYSTGKGKIIVKSRHEIEEKNGKKSIIIREIPYMVNKAELILQIAELVKEKKISGIADLRDESDREGMRIVIQLKKESNPELIINQLHKHTRMQTTFGILMLALADDKPKVMSIKEFLENFILHRKNVVVKRTKFELKKAQDRAHILEGIIKALNNVDLAIKLIRNANTVDDARKQLIGNFSISVKQADAILELKLQKLASLEQEKIREEHKGLMRLIQQLKDVLASDRKIYDIIKDELTELRAKYNDERKTRISNEEITELNMEDLVEEEDNVITITSKGYIKRQEISSYRQQRRGGRGIIAANMREEDFIKDIFIANTHSYILFFTDKGQVYWLKVYYIPEGSRQSQGKAIVNLLNLARDERITAYIAINKFTKGDYLLMATEKGIIKKTSLESYSRPRKGGIIAINLQNRDRLVDVLLTDGNQKILLATKRGMAVKFHEKDVRAVGRNSTGVRGAKLRNEDAVIGMVNAEEKKKLLTLTERGYGKRTRIADYRLINRGGKGVINIIKNKRNGNVVTVLLIDDDEEFMAITRKGIAMRTKGGEISVIGRNTQGVRVMRLGEGDTLVGATKIKSEEEEPEEV
ncbi:DNA gyrase subunit A [Candidatus Woesearchaeota archaeon]|nr:DNA gyrase subunit A [Candidatus Woesearchaeota archaeon]